MHDLWTWYWAVEMLGIAALPTAGLALAHLPDRGWGLAKPLAILLVGVACWLPLVVFPALPFSRGWIVLVLLLFVAANAMLLVLRPRMARDLIAFVRRQWLYVACNEAIFAITLWIMGSLRSLNPQAEGTEKFMDQAFLSAIIRAPHLPPPDPWLSGYPINYYYFGHYLLGMLAKALGTAAPVAFNLGIALTAALAATGIFSVAANLTAAILQKRTLDDRTRNDTESAREDTENVSRSRVIPRLFRVIPRSASLSSERNAASLTWAVPFALFAVIAALVMGNLRSFWTWWGNVTTTALQTHQTTWAVAWNWLTHPALWSNYDYWTPSRAIPRTITEFPDFSFLLADLHAHVLALPYAVLAVGVALHLWLAPPHKGMGIFGAGRGRWVALIAAGLSIGALYLINGWDLPTYLALALVALGLHQWNAHGRQFTAALWADVARAALPLLALCFIPYLPFYLHYVSPGQGIGFVPGLPTHIAIPLSAGDNAMNGNLGTRTAIGDEIGANGVMIAIFASWLLVLLARQLMPLFQFARPWSWYGRDSSRPLFSPSRPSPSPSRPSPSPSRTDDDASESPYIQAHMVREDSPSAPAVDDEPILMVTDLPSPSADGEGPGVGPTHSPAGAWFRAWGVVGLGALFLGALTWLTPLWDGWVLIWGMIFFAAALGLAIAPFASPPLHPPMEGRGAIDRAHRSHDRALGTDAHARTFPLILIAFGAGLIALCEVVFLRDVFLGYGPRMNTVFKAYFQVWLLFALASAPALAWLLTHLPERLPRGILPAWQPVAYIWRGAWVLLIAGLIAVTFTFPLGASHVIYPIGQANVPQSLNGLTDNTSLDFGDIEAIQWMNDHITGDPVIVEGIDPAHSEYSYTIGRVSVFTGLPTIIGWPQHEYQWRVMWLNNPAHAADFNARLGDLHTIYTSTNQQTVLNLLHHYHVQYVYVGAVEEQLYGATSDLSRFRAYMPVVYDTDGVVIYSVPQP